MPTPTPNADVEENFPDLGLDTEAMAFAVRDKIEDSLGSPYSLRISPEGGFPSNWRKQIGFTIWFTRRSDWEAANADGEAQRIEALLRAECVLQGFPEAQQERIYVWTDSEEALSRLMGREEQFQTWVADQPSQATP